MEFESMKLFRMKHTRPFVMQVTNWLEKKVP